MSKAEKIATLQKRSDCRAAFTSGAKPIPKFLVKLEDTIRKLKLNNDKLEDLNL